MEQVSVVSLPQTPPQSPLTLEQAKEELCSLLRESEANAWEIGDLLNRIERSGLARSKGYGKTRSWIDAEVPQAHGKTSTLYRYAAVAAHYTKEDVRSRGIAILEYLMVHDQETVGQPLAGDPSEREIELVLPGGLKRTKRFSDCTANELRLSNQLRKQKKGSSSRASKKAIAIASASHDPTHETYSPRQSLVLLGLGIVISPLSQLLPAPVSFWAGFIAIGLIFTGAAMLIRHGRMFWNRFLGAVKERRGISFLKETLADLRHSSRRLAAAVRSGVKEPPPPTEKKAA